MVGALLLRGMLIGILAGLLSFGFLKLAGEPSVDRAIAFETQMDEAKAKAEVDAAAAKGLPAPAEEAEPELVSRPVQSGLGLFTGVVVFGAAMGGLFALAFALVHGRFGDLGARALSALLAAEGFVAVYLVPMLKYPANPPSVGDPETIGARTALYFGMVAISLVAMVAASNLRRALLPRLGAWEAALIGGVVYIVAVLVAGMLLPVVDEVPAGFPPVVLWQFRIASLGGQAVLWAVIGLLFGALTERAMAPRGTRAFALPR